jgi:hypothetical protein
VKLSPHFQLDEFTHSEFAERNHLDNTPTGDVVGRLQRLAMRLELMRDILRKPIVISSGYRSPSVNSQIGGSKTSAHMRGDAADLLCPGFGRPEDVMKRIRPHFRELAWDQLILEYPRSQSGGWLHFGLADKPRGQTLVTHDGKEYLPL